MSLLGQKRTCLFAVRMSAFDPTDTIRSKRTLTGCSLLLPRQATEGDDGPHDFFSRGGCWSFGLQRACDGRRSNLVRRDKLWRVLGLPVSLA
jgi:hypothetical protein